MAQSSRISVKGVRRREISSEDLAYIYFLMGKAALRAKRDRAAQEKAKRRGTQSE
jgi:hypothetical protein